MHHAVVSLVQVAQLVLLSEALSYIHVGGSPRK